VVPLLMLGGLLGLGVLPCHWVPGWAAGALGPPAGTAQAMPVAQSGPSQEVRIDLSEWALTPSTVAVAAGRPVRFVASNSGGIPHALAVEGSGVYAETATIGSAATARLEITFAAPGLYDLFCPIGVGQHRLLGQDGRMAVVDAVPGVRYPQSGEAAEEAVLLAVLGPLASAPPAEPQEAPAPEAPAEAPAEPEAPAATDG
jgi:plastocyanin